MKVLIVGFLLILSSACNKCEDEVKTDGPSIIIPKDFRHIRLCHQAQTWTKESMENNFLGEWKWRFQETFGNWGGSDTTWEHTTLELEFFQDNVLIIKEHGSEETVFWQIRTGTPSIGFSLYIAGNNEQHLIGDLSLCDNNFTLSYLTTGTEAEVFNYFIRKD